MRRLKNWTITARPIKGRDTRDAFLSYYHYLISNEGKHKNQTITNLTGKKSAYNIMRKADAFNLIRRLGKGGRPSNVAFSVVKSFPFEIDDKTMKQIFVSNMRKFYRYVSDENNLGLTKDDIEALIEKETVAVVHRGHNLKGEPINNHIHTLIQKHFKLPNKPKSYQPLISIDLTKKKYLRALKLFNNDTVYEVMGMELFDYEIKSKQTQKKRLTASQYQQKKIYEKQTVEKVDEATQLLEEVMAHIEDYKKWANENNVHDEEHFKMLLRAIHQVENGNTKRAKKTLCKYKNHLPTIQPDNN